MTFSWPWALLSLLIIPIVCVIVWLLRRRRRSNHMIPHTIGMISSDNSAHGQLNVITRAFPSVRR